MIKTLKTLIHHLTPKQFLTRAAGFFAEKTRNRPNGRVFSAVIGYNKIGEIQEE